MGILDEDYLRAATVNPNLMRQGILSRTKPPMQMKELTPQGLLDGAALATSPIPIVGDVAGLAADGLRMYQNPQERTWGNAALASLGLLPFVPNMSAVRKLTKYEEAHKTAQKNAAKPVSEGGLGLPPDNTAMDRAKAMGFDMDVYHGSNDISKTEAFDPYKVVDNAQYGGKFYSSIDPEYANKYANNSLLGDSPGVIPLMMRSGKRFNMTQPVDANDAANIMEQLGQYERSDKIRASGKPYRNGNELFYWGLDSSLPNNTKGDAILRSGFDSIHGDPKLEIVGEAGKPHSVVSDPSRLRSRFAAFDPLRRNENNLLASFAPYGLAGLLGLGLLDSQNAEAKK